MESRWQVSLAEFRNWFSSIQEANRQGGQGIRDLLEAANMTYQVLGLAYVYFPLGSTCGSLGYSKDSATYFPLAQVKATVWGHSHIFICWAAVLCWPKIG